MWPNLNLHSVLILGNWVTRDYKKHNIPTTAKENSLDQIHTMCQRIKVYVDMLNAVKSVSDVSSVSPSLEQRRTLETSANTLFTAFSISTSTLRWTLYVLPPRRRRPKLVFVSWPNSPCFRECRSQYLNCSFKLCLSVYFPNNRKEIPL